MQLVQPQQPMELTTLVMHHTTLTVMQATEDLATEDLATLAMPLMGMVVMVMVNSSTESMEASMEASSSMESMGNMVCLEEEEANSRSGSNLKKPPFHSLLR